MGWLIAVALSVGGSMWVGGIGAAQELHILTTSLPPAAYLKDGKPTGYCVDLAEEIERTIGSPPAPIDFLPWPRAYHEGLHGANILLLCPKRTADRETHFSWVGPVAASRFGFYVKADSPLSFSEMAEIDRNLAIVVPRDFYFIATLKEHGLTNIEEVNTTEDAIRLLISGRARMVVVEADLAENVLKTEHLDGSQIKLAHPLYESLEYFAFSAATDSAIVEKWKEAFARLDASGEVGRLRRRYFTGQ